MREEEEEREALRLEKRVDNGIVGTRGGVMLIQLEAVVENVHFAKR